MDIIAHYYKTIEFTKRVKEIKEIIEYIEHKYKHKGNVTVFLSTHAIEPIIATTRDYCEKLFIDWGDEIMNLHRYSNRTELLPIKDVMIKVKTFTRKLEKVIKDGHVCKSCELGKTEWLFIDSKIE